ncbi:efflux RND transporter periplasmic adaptor subunit [Exilibacterium tricleocarpae]|uniref:Efflux RND transporter periplasmic adaptor subunit n=1 Tax=Exilibacterium tricleocarpae TaxID=2591008 RepID=A0A545TLX7_9GAMM|nr:efflux RND transporter periplasmic adaptor subunit [Exilibacterium tricleocarpae]TQV78194.1 efflux RND transporter periplasmic adaptor subunit [Exilibacterium tricleocarpae]
MSSKFSLSKGWLIAIGILLAVVLWMVSGPADHSDQSGSDAAESLPAAATAPLVEVRESVAQPMTNQLSLAGRTLADRTVTVRAETAGPVQALLVERGVAVAAGDALVRFAIEDRQVRLLQARSGLAEAEANHSAAKALKQQGYEAETALARQLAALDAAKAAVRAAELELARAEVSAPIAGVVNERLVEVGDFVERGDPLAVIVDLDPMRVVGQVSERYLGQIAVGIAGEARLLDGEQRSGEVRYVGRIADEVTRTFPVELEVANDDGRLIQGITAELLLPVEQVYAHYLPPSVLTLADDGVLGIKAVSDGAVRFHPVEIVGNSNSGVWLAGLPARLQVITAGQAFVRNGQPVTVAAADLN